MTAPSPASVSASLCWDVSSASFILPVDEIFLSLPLVAFSSSRRQTVNTRVHNYTHTQNIRSRSYQEHMSWMDFHLSSIATQSRVPVLCFLWRGQKLHSGSDEVQVWPKVFDRPSPWIFQHFCIFQHYELYLWVSNELVWSILASLQQFLRPCSLNCLASSFRA